MPIVKFLNAILSILMLSSCLTQKFEAPRKGVELKSAEKEKQAMLSLQKTRKSSAEMSYVELHPSLVYLVDDFGVPFFTEIVGIPSNGKIKNTIHHLWEISPQMRILAITSEEGDLLTVLRAKKNQNGIYESTIQPSPPNKNHKKR